MYPYFKTSKRSKKKKCFIYKKKDGTEKELNLKVHRSFLLFRYFNNKIPESVSPLIQTTIPIHEMHLIYKCVLFSYLSYKDRTKIIFPPEIKIEYEMFDSDVRRIPFFIATDSSSNSIIVSCRGSSCKDDFITDSLGNGISYGGGRFHEGIFSTASYVFLTCQNKIIELNNLYNDESINDNDNDESSYTDNSYNNYSDDNSEEESESEEEETKNENSFSFHKSVSNDELHLYSKSSISLQRSASSEELNLHINSISNSSLISCEKPKIKRSDSNDIPDSNDDDDDISTNMPDTKEKAMKKPQLQRKKQKKNKKDDNENSNENLSSHSIRRSTSNDELSSHRRGSISMSDEDLHLHYDSIPNTKKLKLKSNKNSDSDSNNNDFSANMSELDDSKFSDSDEKSKSNKNKKQNLYQNFRNKPTSTPILATHHMHRSTSEENLNTQQEVLTFWNQKSISVNNLQKKFQKLTEIENSHKNADSETEPVFDSIYVNKMRKKKTKIIITGHSLGASVAAVVAYLFRQKFPELDVRCICFAPPPTLSFNLWRQVGKYVKSFMIEGDVVPFLSVRNLLAISDIMFPHQHSNKKFKKMIINYLEKKSLEKFQVNKALEEKLYPPGQMYLIRFTNEIEGGIRTLRKRIKKRIKERKNRKNIDEEEEVRDDEIQLCQILNPDYFSNLVKNIQENNHAVKNYMRLIIRLTNIFRKQKRHH